MGGYFVSPTWRLSSTRRLYCNKPAVEWHDVIVHPSRGICLQHLHGLCNAESRSHIDQGVILDATDRDCVHAVFFLGCPPCMPIVRLQVLRDHLQAVFRAEYDVDVAADVRTGHCVVPVRQAQGRLFGTLLLKPHATRHSRAGLQVVPSLRDSRVANLTTGRADSLSLWTKVRQIGLNSAT
jgi:hypothetical protein